MFNNTKIPWMRWGRNGILTLFLIWFVLVLSTSWFNVGAFFSNGGILTPVLFPIFFIEYLAPNILPSIHVSLSPIVAALVVIVCYFFLGIVVGYLNDRFRNKNRVFIGCFLILILASIFYILYFK